MAHELEQFSDGSTAFVSARLDAWHRLGTVLPSTFTAEEAMTTAHLGGWNVRKSPLTTTVDERTLTVPGAYATVRTHPKTGEPDVLGYVGEQWQPVQNEELADFLNVLSDESGAHFETAGSLKEGRHVFITMKMPEAMTIGDGTDDLDLYIAAMNAHDGTASMRAVVSPVRIVCANTQAAALRQARSTFTIRHTSGVTSKVAEAREALRLTWKYLEAFQLEAEKMLQTSMRDVDFTNKIRRLFPIDADAGKRAKENNDAVISQLRYLYSEADTNANIRGSRWAGYQSVVEYLDHFAPVQGADDETARAIRAERVLIQSSVTKLKRAAFDAFVLAS
ncbi:DUF932 domain-containing protein [Nocardiopsis tropica]|uniref:DUF932 domain-containing protein n=1 Tax=Nocardiopsis tropica TaxID=109330 RepID=UPI002E892083|nr:DUF932 domain-containing protein [Nocardiopsis tropica]